MTGAYCSPTRHVHKPGNGGCVCGYIPTDGSPVPTCTGCGKGAIKPGCPAHDPQTRKSQP